MIAAASLHTNAGIMRIKRSRDAMLAAAHAVPPCAMEYAVSEKDAKLTEKAALDRLCQERAPNIWRFNRIVDRACRVFRTTKLELAANRRNRELALARQFVMYWTVRLTQWSYPHIGRMMKRDHTTILHGKDAYIRKRASKGRKLRVVR